MPPLGGATETFVDAHRRSVDAIRSGPGDAPVGLTLSMTDVQALPGGEARRDQMLGRMVTDPSGVEEGGWQCGLDFLPVETELELDKVTVQSKGRSFLGTAVDGYEIHMGRTHYIKPVDPFITRDDGSQDGVLAGHVAGTYFHGLFDNIDFTTKFLTRIAETRHLEWRPSLFRYSKDDEYDRLAAAARQHLKIDQIWEMLE